MKAMMAALAATALVGLLASGAPSRAEEDCDNVVKALDEAISIGNKNFEATMDELKQTMSRSADDKSKAAVKNKVCSASGELLGTSRAVRAVVAECSDKRAAIASLDKSIKEIETAIERTCN